MVFFLVVVSYRKGAMPVFSLPDVDLDRFRNMFMIQRALCEELSKDQTVIAFGRCLYSDMDMNKHFVLKQIVLQTVIHLTNYSFLSVGIS